ncbi:Fatty acid desaturase [Burkholderia sp. OK233]|nr:Fatty acid desaturase [Burkholderia sp. OK233]
MAADSSYASPCSVGQSDARQYRSQEHRGRAGYRRFRLAGFLREVENWMIPTVRRTTLAGRDAQQEDHGHAWGADYRSQSPVSNRIGAALLGPPMSVGAMLRYAWRALRSGDLRHIAMWLAHGATVAVLLAWVQFHAGVPWWYYLLAVTWPALDLAMVRSLYEHRAESHPKARIVINEAGLFMRLLYLNNNYHLVHHDLPDLPWFHLPHAYRIRREDYRNKCRGFVIRGYGELLKRYAL